MPVSIREIIGEEDLVALTYHQALEPVEGEDGGGPPPDVPWPAGEQGQGRTALRVRDQRSGGRKRMCELDTVQSQANRMEASYRGSLAELIRGTRSRRGTVGWISPRSGSAWRTRRSVRRSSRSPRAIRRRSLAPTSLVYGAWDSRDTWVKVRRAIASRIEAHDVVECTRSAQYTGSFRRRRARSYRRRMEEGCEGGLRAVASDRSAGGDPGAGGDRAVGDDRAWRAAGVRDGCGGRGAGGYLLGLALGDSSPGVVGTTFGPGASSCRRARPLGRRCPWRASGERSRSMPRRCSRSFALVRTSGPGPRTLRSEASPRSTGSTSRQRGRC